MLSEIFEIRSPLGRLATMARPLGGVWLESEIAALKKAGVTDLVSMLTVAEDWELELTSEAKQCATAGIRFHRHRIPDRGVPEQPDFDLFIDKLEPILRRGEFIVSHCRGGIGRSSLIAAALLCRLGVMPEEALSLISEARGFEVPDTEAQREFVMEL